MSQRGGQKNCVMVSFHCQLDQVEGCLQKWQSMLLGVTGRVFPQQTGMWAGQLGEEAPSLHMGSSSPRLMAQVEWKSRKEKLSCPEDPCPTYLILLSPVGIGHQVRQPLNLDLDQRPPGQAFSPNLEMCLGALSFCSFQLLALGRDHFPSSAACIRSSRDYSASDSRSQSVKALRII